MYAHAQIFDIIIQLLLFGLLLYKLYDLAYAYARPWLIDELNAEKRKHLELIERDRLLTTIHKKTEAQLEAQRQLFLTLEANAANVERFIIEQQAKNEAAFAATAEKIRTKRMIQEKNNRLAKECEEIFAQALQQAHDELQHHFVHQHDSEHLNVVINLLPRLHSAKD